MVMGKEMGAPPVVLPILACVPQAPSGWTMCSVGVVRAPWQSVFTTAGAPATATTVRMPAWCAQDSACPGAPPRPSPLITWERSVGCMGLSYTP